jgi:hypothetical protein
MQSIGGNGTDNTTSTVSPSSGGNGTEIDGFTYYISGQTGSQEIQFDASSAFAGCIGKQRISWALFEPLGANEFGKDLGYSLDPNYRPPSLVYNCNSTCVSGGHAPPNGTQGLCPDAAWDALGTVAGGSCRGRPRLVRLRAQALGSSAEHRPTQVVTKRWSSKSRRLLRQVVLLSLAPLAPLPRSIPRLPLGTLNVVFRLRVR